MWPVYNMSVFRVGLSRPLSDSGNINPIRRTRIRWWLHPTSTFTLLALAVFFTFAQFQPKQGYVNGGATQYTDQRFYGWPRIMLDRTTTRSLTKGAIFPLSTATTTNVVDDLNVFNLCVNVLACVIALASTIFCIERWTRRSNRWQYGLRDAATVILVGSLVFAFYEPTFGQWALPTFGLFPHVGFDVASMPTHILIPFLAGAYFVVYSCCAIILAALNAISSLKPTKTIG